MLNNICRYTYILYGKYINIEDKYYAKNMNASKKCKQYMLYIYIYIYLFMQFKFEIRKIIIIIQQLKKMYIYPFQSTNI